MRWIIAILSIASCLMPWRMALAGGTGFEPMSGAVEIVTYRPCNGWPLTRKGEDTG
ncbi:MAG: hypothetical protein ABJF86_11755 [Tateyamaria sp.]|uniref:hypothetical protein n=1 Tax=Tateyamaria sp. TaxID=1929288 RepID=UPI00328496FB